MKIVHLVPTGAWAGTETVAAGYARYQTAHGHRVWVVVKATSDFSEQFYLSKLAPNAEVVFLPSGIGGTMAQARHIADLIGEVPDIIHGHLGPGCRITRDWPSQVPLKVGTMHIRYFAPHFGDLDAVTAISPWQLMDVPASFRGRKYLVTNFLPPSKPVPQRQIDAFRRRIHADEGTFVIGSIGRLHIEKGMDILCRAFMKAALPNAQLVVLGSGPEHRRLEALAAPCPNIKFLGYVHEAARCMPAFDLYASGGRGEAFGLTLLEAMQFGVPIVSTATYGATDVLAAMPERLVPRDDVDSMADAFIRAYSRRESKLSYDLDRFDYKASNEAMLAAYEDLLSTRAARPAGEGRFRLLYTRAMTLAGKRRQPPTSRR